MNLDPIHRHDHDIRSRTDDPLWFDLVTRDAGTSHTDPAEAIYGCGGCLILLLIASLPLVLIGTCVGN